MKPINIFFLFFLALFLASCASVPLPGKQNTTSAALPVKKIPTWQEREAQLNAIHSWNLNAALALRGIKDNVTGHLQWQQTNKNYSLYLYGTLGVYSMRLNGGPGNVYLETSDGHKSSASSPELLLQQQLGWRLPVTHLLYWVRGLPVPSLPAKKQLDSENRLSLLQQDNWNIQFLNYSTVNNVELPNKILLTHPDLQVKLVINQWQLPI